MAKSARAIAHSPRIAKSIKPPSVTAKRRRAPVAKQEAPEPPESAMTNFSEVEDAFCNLADSYRAYECLQSFLSPRYPLRGVEEFHIEPTELRGLVTVLNADMDRQLQALRGAIRGVREKIVARVPDRP